MIFVDSSFWIAFRNQHDDHHAEALDLVREHAAQDLVTTNHVRGEAWTFLRRRVGHAAAVEFLDCLEQSPRLEAAFVSSELEGDALSWLRRHDERAYSFVDATSFALMRSRGITDALAFDEDFTAAGFRELRIDGARRE